MKAKTLTELLVSLSFLAMIAAPASFDLLADKQNTGSVEKRGLAQRPDPGSIWGSFSRFTAQFERYYDDSFGLRESLIRWNNHLRLELLKESPIRGVRVGRAGWFFYADEWDLEDYENVMPYIPKELKKIRTILEQRRRWLAQRGIQFFVMVAPNKQTIYPEYLPPAIHKIGRESRLDQVVQYLEAYPEIAFIDVRGALLTEKAVQRLYHRTDSHWNDYGAFIGYRAVMERIQTHLPKARKLSLDEFTVTSAEGEGGDLANMLSLKDEIREERIVLVPNFKPQAVDGTRDYPNLAQLPGRETVIKETKDLKLPKALVFRDSFAWPLIPYLSESFRSIVFIWTFDFLPEIIEREKPDVVILECAERYINALTMENPEGVRAVYPQGNELASGQGEVARGRRVN